MRITTKIIAKMNPCYSRFRNFKKHYPRFNGDVKKFIMLEHITFSDKLWVVTKLLSKEQCVLFAIMCAENVLHYYEKNYPNDDRPRLAIEAAKAYLNITDAVAYAAARAAYTAATDATYATAATNDANAAYAAAHAAGTTAAYTYAAHAATYAATHAANATGEKDVFLTFLLEVLEM